MKLVSTDGRFHAYDFPEDVVVCPQRVMAMLEHHVHEDDRIDSLCLDFCGSYVPIAHRAELRIVCALLCTYAGSHEARFDEVSPLSPPRVRLRLQCSPPGPPHAARPAKRRGAAASIEDAPVRFG